MNKIIMIVNFDTRRNKKKAAWLDAPKKIINLCFSKVQTIFSGVVFNFIEFVQRRTVNFGAAARG